MRLRCWQPAHLAGLAATVWQKLATVEGKGDASATLSRQQYLDAIIPGKCEGTSQLSW